MQLLSYGNEEFKYKFQDPVKKKLIISIDVTFFEDQNIEEIQKGGTLVISK